jgi:hypothetical protein
MNLLNLKNNKMLETSIKQLQQDLFTKINLNPQKISSLEVYEILESYINNLLESQREICANSVKLTMDTGVLQPCKESIKNALIK